MSAPSSTFSSVGTRFIASSVTPFSTSGYIIPAIDATSVSMAGIMAASIDVTALNSVWKAYILGTLDFGTLEINGFAKSSTALPLPSSGSSTPQRFSLVLGKGPQGTNNDDPYGWLRYDFFAYQQAVSYTAAVDEMVGLTITLRLTDGLRAFTRHPTTDDWVQAYAIGRDLDVEAEA